MGEQANWLSKVGTTTVYPHGDQRLRPIELGASIFVESNRHLMKSAKVSSCLKCNVTRLIERYSIST